MGVLSNDEQSHDAVLLRVSRLEEAYLAYASAVHWYGVGPRPEEVHVVSPRRYKLARSGGLGIRPATVKREKFFGFARQRRAGIEILVSDKEKTLLDCLERMDRSGGILPAARFLLRFRADLALDRLLEYGIRMRNSAVFKRLGFLIEFYGLHGPREVAPLRARIGKGVSPLDPTRPALGRIVSRWGLRLNAEPAALEQIRDGLPGAAALVDPARFSLPECGAMLLKRPQLLRKVSSLAARKRLVSLVAPTGYGKTTLMAEVSRATRLVPCPLRFHPGDGELRGIARLLLASLARAFPGLDPQLACVIERIDPGRIITDLPVLLHRELSSLARQGVLFLWDDFQNLAQAREITTLIDGLLAHLPVDVHWIVASQVDLPLDLCPLRLRGDILELGEDDLAFDREELGRLVRARLAFEPGAGCLERLHRRTRGWVAMTALLLHGFRGTGPQDLAREVEELQGSEKDIYTFLANRLFEREPPEIREFMTAVAPLGAIDHAIAEHLCPSSRGQGWIDHLERRHVLHPMDRQRVRYEFHPLFRRFLLAHLERTGGSRAREIHRQAARFYLALGQGDAARDAIDHLLEADDAPDAAAALEGRVEDLFTRGELSWLDETLARLRGRLSPVPPWVTLWHGRVLERRGRFQDALRLYTDLDRSLSAGHVSERIELLLSLGQLQRTWGSPEDASATFARGLALCDAGRLPAEDRVGFVAGQGFVHMAAGRDRLARTRFSRALATYRSVQRPSQVASMYQHLGVASYRLGDLARAVWSYRRSLAIYREQGDRWGTAHCLSHLGVSLLVMGEYREGMEILEDALALHQQLRDLWGQTQGLIRLGSAHRVTGDYARADRCYTQAEDLAASTGVPRHRVELLLCRSDYFVKLGRPLEASRCTGEARRLMPALAGYEAQFRPFLDASHGAIARARGKVRAAIRWYEKAVDGFSRLHFKYELAGHRWALAHVHDACGEMDRARELMHKVARQASRSGYVFWEWDTYAPLYVVGLTTGRGATFDYCSRILALIPPDQVEAALAGLSRPELVETYRRHMAHGPAAAGRHRITSHERVRIATEQEVLAIRSDRRRTILLVDVPERVVRLPDGRLVALGQSKTLLALFTHFLRNPRVAFDLAALSGAVWGVPVPNPSHLTRVRVAIARLRRLLGDEPDLIVTLPAGRAGEHRGARYGLRSGVEFVLLERAEGR
jgi:LuxR family maltose regulon positive regulatory protein